MKRKNVEEDRQTAKKQKTKFAADHHAMVYKSAFTQATIPEEVLEGFTVAAVNNLDIIGLVQDQKRSKHNNALLSLQIDRIAMKMKQKLDLTKIHPLPGITRNDLSKRAVRFPLGFRHSWRRLTVPVLLPGILCFRVGHRDCFRQGTDANEGQRQSSLQRDAGQS